MSCDRCGQDHDPQRCPMRCPRCGLDHHPDWDGLVHGLASKKRPEPLGEESLKMLENGSYHDVTGGMDLPGAAAGEIRRLTELIRIREGQLVQTERLRMEALSERGTLAKAEAALVEETARRMHAEDCYDETYGGQCPKDSIEHACRSFTWAGLPETAKEKHREEARKALRGEKR